MKEASEMETNFVLEMTTGDARWGIIADSAVEGCFMCSVNNIPEICDNMRGKSPDLWKIL